MHRHMFFVGRTGLLLREKTDFSVRLQLILDGVTVPGDLIVGHKIIIMKCQMNYNHFKSSLVDW